MILQVPLISIGTTKFFSEYTSAHYAGLTVTQIGHHTIAELAFQNYMQQEWASSHYAGETVLQIGHRTMEDLAFTGAVQTNPPIKSESLQVDDTVQARSTASFQLKDLAEIYRFDYGQEVKIIDPSSGFPIFGGLIVQPKEKMISQINGGILHTISCADYHLLAENRTFYGGYVATTGGAIAHDIFAVLEEEGVAIGQIDTGIVLTNVRFPKDSCANCLNKLAQLNGYIWWISSDKRFYFVDPTTYAANYDIIAGSHILKGSLTLTRGNPEYRNLQLITGTTSQTASRSEPFVGDGTRRTFTLGYPVSSIVSMDLDGVTIQTFGVAGVDTTENWFYTIGSNSITQNTNGTVLSGAHILNVTYIGSFPLIVSVEQKAEITRQRLAQGFGTGKIERITQDTSLYDKDSAKIEAKAMLAELAVVGDQVSYSTNDAGLTVGVLQSIQVNTPSINDDFLLYHMRTTYKHSILQFDVDGARGPVQQSWQTIFCKLGNASRIANQSAASTNATVNGLEPMDPTTWTSGEHPNPFIREHPGGLPSDIDFPCFNNDNALCYLVLYTAGIEFFRKPITLQTWLAAEVDTTVIVLSEEANGIVISHVGLWGGDTCSMAPGSGIEMCKKALIPTITKNSLVSIQFDFVDLKGW
jgi:hypothetical protein